MTPGFVLVHSPSVGPSTWAPVADRLRALGRDAVVPSLREVGEGDPPFWPRVVEAVAEATRALATDQPVLLVAHSNAGLFVPVLVAETARPVHGCLFVDAALPARQETTPVASAEMLDFLRSKMAEDGRLPRWTDWWDDEDVAELFPDAATQAVMTAEQPRLPLAYYEQRVPVPAGWDETPCGYLFFGPPYDDVAAEARDRSWLVEALPGGHLHQVVDPDATAARLISMADRFATAP
jgi:pimeloyl-ACP methyl ester carboxylesterase